jgi:hypothetical protein
MYATKSRMCPTKNGQITSEAQRQQAEEATCKQFLQVRPEGGRHVHQTGRRTGWNDSGKRLPGAIPEQYAVPAVGDVPSAPAMGRREIRLHLLKK